MRHESAPANTTGAFFILVRGDACIARENKQNGRSLLRPYT